MSSIYSIYSAFCVVTGQRYIGFDSHWPRRKQSHKREYKKEKYNIKFYNAIRKYGWDNFIWEILYQSKDGEHCLNVMEEYFINEYDSSKNGYNIVKGGQRGPILPGKLNGMYGKTHTKKVKEENAIAAHKRFKGKSYEELYGKEKSDELKKIRSQFLKGKDNNFIKNPRFDSNIYKFFNIKTGQLLICTQWVFYKNNYLSKSSTNEIINKGIIRNNWTILYT